MPSEVTGRVGTSVYMSPEVADGWARYDSKVDIYRSCVASLLALVHPELRLRASAVPQMAHLTARLQASVARRLECCRTARPPDS